MKIRGVGDLDNAVTQLDALAREATNAATAGTVGPAAWRDDKRHYLIWTEQAVEAVLKSIFDDVVLWRDELYTERHWQIRAIADPRERGAVLMTNELTDQAERLRGLASQLIALRDRAAAADGTFAVVDTHILLHFEPPDQVDWCTVVAASPVRLVVPLRVLEEVDGKKYTGRTDVAERARSVVSRLRKTHRRRRTAGPAATRRHDRGPRR